MPAPTVHDLGVKGGAALSPVHSALANLRRRCGYGVIRDHAYVLNKAKVADIRLRSRRHWLRPAPKVRSAGQGFDGATGDIQSIFRLELYFCSSFPALIQFYMDIRIAGRSFAEKP